MSWLKRIFDSVSGGNFDTGKEKEETVEERRKRLAEDDPKTLADFYRSQNKRR